MEHCPVAILATDWVVYSRLMEADEGGTRAVLKAHRKELTEPKIAEHHGCVSKLMADSMSMELGGVVDALLITVVSLSRWAQTDRGLAECGNTP